MKYEKPQSGEAKVSDDNKCYKFIKKCSVHLFDEMITKTLTDIKKAKNDIQTME